MHPVRNVALSCALVLGLLACASGDTSPPADAEPLSFADNLRLIEGVYRHGYSAGPQTSGTLQYRLTVENNQVSGAFRQNSHSGKVYSGTMSGQVPESGNTLRLEDSDGDDWTLHFYRSTNGKVFADGGAKAFFGTFHFTTARRTTQTAKQ